MILVDSSVWIDRLARRTTVQTVTFDRLNLAEERLCVGDLIVAEVLQGIGGDRAFATAIAALDRFDLVAIADRAVAIEAARHFRLLRARGVTVRKTIDTLIATRCILDDMPLLYADRDFDPFVRHLGLRSAVALFQE